jgi:hypothetical protein
MALAHTVQNQVEAAYRRGDLLDKRRALMQGWADYLAGCEMGSALMRSKRRSDLLDKMRKSMAL